MPRLPDVQGQSQAPIPQPAGGVAGYEPTSYRQGGRTAETLSSIGRDFDEASSIVAATNDRQDSIVAQAAANDLNQTRITQEFDPKTGFRNIKEGGTVGQKFIDDYTKRFEDSQVAFRDKLTNENQKRLYDQHAAVQSLQYKSALLLHQSQETEKFNISTANSRVKLQLQGMATNPMEGVTFENGEMVDNNVAFKIGMATIDGTINEMGKQRGWVDQNGQLNEIGKEIKSQMLDAAYTTRITSMIHGIPGVVEANPYAAEKMFRSVQKFLGPQSQVTLAGQVQTAIHRVEDSQYAKGMVFGKQPTPAAEVAKVVTGPPLTGIIAMLEGGGRTQNKDGTPLLGPMTSSGARAEGGMQVMPATQDDPGFGVKPVAKGQDGKPLPGERERVGVDYANAMNARYDGLMPLVLAAYNAGPFMVDDWMNGTNATGKNPSRTRLGDPRTGQISPEEFAAKIPFAETKNYVEKGMRMAGPQTQQFVSAPSANQLKLDLNQRIQAAMDSTTDPQRAQARAALVGNMGHLVISNQLALEANARDGLYAGMIGTKPDGSDKPLTINQMLADPQMQRNWDQATPETKMAIQNHFKTGNGDVPRTPETETMTYQLKGLATLNRDRFASYPLEKLIGKVPHADFHELTNLQMSARNKETKDADKDINKARAMSDVKEMWAPMIANKDKAVAAKLTEQFTGRFLDMANAQHEKTGKWPTTAENKKNAAILLAQGVEKGTGWFGTDVGMTKKMVFQMADSANFIVPLPGAKSPEYAAAVKEYQDKYKKTPTAADLQAEVTRMVLQHGKTPPWLTK